MQERFLDWTSDFLNVFVRLCGPLFPIFGSILILFCAWTYFAMISLLKIPFFLFALNLLFCLHVLVIMFFNLYQAISISTSVSEFKDATNGKTCRKCLQWKPARAHHCSVCRACIYKMDHHWYFLNSSN